MATTFQRLEDRKVGKREIIVIDTSFENNLGECQLLVFGGRDRKRIALALEEVKDEAILTIGELPDFIDSGGIIRLYQENDSIRFEINPYSARRSDLQISARLLQLAKIVGK